MRLYKIIKKPIVTEKASNLEMANSCFVAKVAKDATKVDIKKTILDLYGLVVSSVNILNTRGKTKNGKKGPQIRSRSYKKAYITLKDKGSKIDFSLVK